VPRQHRWLLGGTALLLAGAVAMFVKVYVGSLVAESLPQVVLLCGGVIVSVAVARYSSLVEAQLLRSDLKASLLGSLLVIAVWGSLSPPAREHAA
jgi:hypothetical protein